jgi:hypothetical protein
MNMRVVRVRVKNKPVVRFINGGWYCFVQWNDKGESWKTWRPTRWMRFCAFVKYWFFFT